MIQKRTVTLGAIGGSLVGGALPLLWGDYNSFDATSLLLGMMGGFGGIWLAVWLSKRFEL